MAYIASTQTTLTGQKGFFSGILAAINEDWSKAKHIPFPPNCAAIESRPSGDNYINRQYLVGGFSKNIVIDEDFRAFSQGILPPPSPSVSSGAGALVQIGYLRFYGEVSGERSSLSAGKSFTGDINRVWTALPTEVPGELIIIDGTADIAAGVVTGINGATNFHDLRPGDRVAISTALTRWSQVRSIQSATRMEIDDTGMAGSGVSLVVKPLSRVSHVETWASVSGALPRFSARVRIGTTSVSESVATLALGEALIDSYEPMPTGSFNLIYNSRQLVAGVEGRLDRVFLSEIGYPERYAGLNFFTKYGEPIVGLVRARDYVVVICPKSSYRLQGFTENDYVLTVLEPEIGGIGHGGNAVCGGRIFVPSREQIQIFDGAFRNAMPSRQSEWSRNVRQFEDSYQGGVGMVDPESQTYRFLPSPLRLVGGSLPISIEESAPASGFCAEWGNIALGPYDGVRRSYSVDGAQGLHRFSPDQAPVLQVDSYTPDGVDTAIGASGDNVAWIGGTGGADPNAVTLKRFDRARDTVLVASATKTRADAVVSSIAKYQGEIYLYAGYTGLAGPDDRVYRYNGGSALVVDDAAAGQREGMLIANGADLYLIGGSSVGGGYVRRKNGGAWANVPTTSGPFPTPYTNGSGGGRGKAAVYRGSVYCLNTWSEIGVGNFVTIVKLDGNTAVAVHTTPDEYAGGSGLTVFNDRLYYLLLRGPALNLLTLGEYDGTTWNDLRFDFSANHPPLDDFPFQGTALSLVELAGSLHLRFDGTSGAAWHSPPCVCNWASSYGTDVGAWYIQHARHPRPAVADMGSTGYNIDVVL